MKDSSKSNLIVPSEDELIEKAIANALELLDIPYKYKGKSFDNFNIAKLTNKNPDLIIADFQKYAKNYIKNQRTPNWLVLKGSSGSGKTHLIIATLKESLSQAVAHNIRNNPNKHDRAYQNLARDFIFTTCGNLFQEIKNSYDCDDINERDVLERYKNCRMLVLDDLGTEQTSKWFQERLFHILDYRYGEMLPIIITTNLTTQELLNHVGERTFKRIIENADKGNNLYKLKTYNPRQNAS